MKNIAIFASGSGSNAQRIMEHFENNAEITVRVIVCNNPNAKVIERAAKFNVPVELISKHDFTQTQKVVNMLHNHQIDLVVLAGFLWLIPSNLIEAFPNKIINLHPALLPSYGGKGMYGMNVHHAVIANRESQSGITIHYVNAQYDEGKIIAQFICKIENGDTAEDLAKKIHILEHQNLPIVIENVINS